MTGCWASTGRAPVKVKSVVINKGDSVNHDYHSRLVAEQFKTDKRLDFVAAMPPLEAQNALFSAAVAEGIGFKQGDWHSGMAIDFADISRSFFQSDASRLLFAELRPEDSAPGMCGRLKKSTDGTRDAAQNWGYAHAEFMVAEAFRKGPSSPCVFWHQGR